MNVKILIVEDDADDSQALSVILADMDADVTIAEDGHRGLNAIFQTQFDLVLLDLKLPVLDGVGVLCELQKRGAIVPVVVFTGYKDKREPVFDVGYEGLINILYKPVEPETLECLVKFISWRKRGVNVS
jgi:DNA-binding response OmpR family regulator